MLAADPPQPLSWISKYVSGYAVLISTQALILNLFLAVPWFEVLEFVAILIAPSLLSGPLIYWSKRNPKKINAWLFITGIELHFLWFFSTLLLAGIS